MSEGQSNKNASLGVAANISKWLARGGRVAAFGGPMGWFLGGGVGVIIFFIFIPVLIVVVIALGLSGAVSLPPAPVEAAPTSGDRLGLADNFCEPFTTAVCNVERVKLMNLIESAASWAKMPAAVLAGVLSIEGRHVFSYTNEEVAAFSADTAVPPFLGGIDGQGIDPFNSTQNSCGAIGPMQILVDSSPGYPPLPINDPPCDDGRVLNVWFRYKSAVNIAGVSSLANPDARNIRNALYGAAWKLKCQSGTASTTECSDGSFGSYDNDTTDAWEREDVDAAASAYYGQCDTAVWETGETYCDIVWQYYIDYSGGGVGGELFGWPVSGTMTQGPYEVGSSTHGSWSAIDIAEPTAQPVYATHDGNVFKRPDSDGFGNYVEVFSSTYITRYAHLEAFSPCLDALPNNTMIKAGTYLGTSGWTGFVIPAGSEGRHLHYHIFDDAGFDISLEEFNSLVPETYTKGKSVMVNYSGSECILGP